MENKIYFEKKFYLDKKTGYWISSSCPKIRAHRWVWFNHFGKIPDGHHIHHKDENKSNNEISNLEIISRFDHLSLHASNPKNKERSRLHCEKIRPLTKIWHSSEEGRKWHVKNGKECWHNKKPWLIRCCVCDKEIETKVNHQKTCSNNCKSKLRRDSGVDLITRECPICNTSFIINKYSISKTCGRKCGQKLSQLNQTEKKMCIV